MQLRAAATAAVVAEWVAEAVRVDEEVELVAGKAVSSLEEEVWEEVETVGSEEAYWEQVKLEVVEKVVVVFWEAVGEMVKAAALDVGFQVLLRIEGVEVMEVEQERLFLVSSVLLGQLLDSAH
jgi:hypothetical protein